MRDSQTDNERKQAWIDIKSAVRAYARNPTADAAEKVEACWKTVRKCDGIRGAWKRNPFGGPRYCSHLTPIATHAHENPARARFFMNASTPQKTWPINEIVMRSLLHRGISDHDIAEMYHVPLESVIERRKSLGL